MSNTIIEVEKIAKSYVVDHRTNGDGLRHEIEQAIRNPSQWLKSRKRQHTEKETLWALKHVSFQIKEGDAVGIIGRNGAGKSTLLKILSRITRPTSGRIRLKGRVASLLEVGTGFHQDLTGRENIFLNGAILGMRRAEIRRKFDEIVAFSEVEKFIDTPVKRYSSGMYVRLAFAVAAHLEPEILIVDEVLAVGDAQFQKKCLGKMGTVANQGRTVLFVSHNMASIRILCSTGLLVNQGRVQSFGAISAVVNSYLNDGVEHAGHWLRETPIPQADGIYFEEVRILNERGKQAGHISSNDSFTIEVRVRSNRALENGQISVRVSNQDGIVVLTTCSTDTGGTFTPIGVGNHTFRVTIPGNFLVPGTYTLQLAAHIPCFQLFDLIDNSVAICIEETGGLRTVIDQRLGVVNPIFDWTLERTEAAHR